MNAPVVLFVYNRPLHTEKTLEALMQNDLADKSDLFIFCDGIKENATKEQLEEVEQVKKNIRKKKWCKTVTIVERSQNLGLAKSVISGVSEILNKYKKIIVLEDDIVTNKNFLRFMNFGLESYKDNKSVYGISGYCFPYSGKIKDDTFFLPIMSSWGYSTWLDRWDKIEFNGQLLLEIVNSKSLSKKINFGKLNFYNMLRDQVCGNNNSWAIRFYVTMYLNNGYFLYPKYSLLKNIGFDGTGVNCHSDPEDNSSKSYKEYIEFSFQKVEIKLKRKIVNKFKNEGKSFKKDFYKSIKIILKRIFPYSFIYFFKRK